MHWNYRVVTDFEGASYSIREVYYDDQDQVEGWSDMAIAPTAESPTELRLYLHQLDSAFERPVLDVSDGVAREVA